MRSVPTACAPPACQKNRKNGRYPQFIDAQVCTYDAYQPRRKSRNEHTPGRHEYRNTRHNRQAKPFGGKNQNARQDDVEVLFYSQGPDMACIPLHVP